MKLILNEAAPKTRIYFCKHCQRLTYYRTSPFHKSHKDEVYEIDFTKTMVLIELNLDDIQIDSEVNNHAS